MKTLYISDLDGTLLQPDITLSETTVTILNQLIEQGMNFTIATARTIASVSHILKDLKLTVPIILMNGVCVYDLNKKEYIKIESFTQESTDALLEVIEQHQLKGFVYAIKNGEISTYYEDLSTKALYDFYKERVDLYQKRFTQVDSFSTLSKEPIVYFSLMDTKEALDPVQKTLSCFQELNCTLYKDNYSPDYWFLEIFSKNASKYHAVKYLREQLGYDNIVCFGDNRNDLPLFEASDYKIAVGNAVAELQAAADYITGNNTEHGVAVWLQEHVRLL